MIPTKLQPIAFEGQGRPSCCSPADECSAWQQTIFETDQVIVQVEADQCIDAVEEITGTDMGSPFDNSGPWQRFDGGTLTDFYVPQIFDGDSVRQTVSMTEGAWYKIELAFRIFLNLGGFVPHRIVINGFQQDISALGVTGSYTFYGQWGSGSVIEIQRVNDSGVVSSISRTLIQSCSVTEVDVPDAVVVDLAGNEIDTEVTREIEIPKVTFSYLPGDEAINAGAFRLKITQPCTAPVVLETEPIVIVPESNCFLRVAGCGNNTVHKDFIPSLRTEGVLLDDGPIDEREIARNSVGVHRLTYGHMHRSYLLDIEQCPEHVRDYLYFLPYYETLVIQIGSSTPREYFAVEGAEKGEFSEGDQNLASVSIRLVLKEENNTATYTGRCVPQLPPYVLGSPSAEIAITDDDEEILIPA